MDEIDEMLRDAFEEEYYSDFYLRGKTCGECIYNNECDCCDSEPACQSFEEF